MHKLGTRYTRREKLSSRLSISIIHFIILSVLVKGNRANIIQKWIWPSEEEKNGRFCQQTHTICKVYNGTMFYWAEFFLITNFIISILYTITHYPYRTRMKTKQKRTKQSNPKCIIQYSTVNSFVMTDELNSCSYT